MSAHPRAKRDVVKGWSAGSVRRHTRWLYSVQSDALTDSGRLVGHAVTLTMRDCPVDADEMHTLIRRWIRRMELRGAVRIHWVIEWQRRGVPHVHAALYFDPNRYPCPDHGTLALLEWVDVAHRLRPGAGAQETAPITGAVGWLQYLSKHAARGAAHYQRQGHPEGWTRTGRLWGHRGEWPVVEPAEFQVSMRTFWRYRRLVRSWRIADARAAGSPRRIAQARRMLACNDRHLSEVRGVSEWIESEAAVQLLDRAVGGAL